MMNSFSPRCIYHKESRMPIRRLLLVLPVLLFALPTADAAKVKVWHQHTQSHYDKAKFKDAVVTSEGALRLSRQVKPLAGLEASNVWDLVEDKNGNLYVATGAEGKLYKVTPDGKTSVVYTSKDSHIFSLCATPEGTIYAGTGPSGKLLRVSGDGKVQTAADDLDSYVWSLAYDPASQSVYAGTGPKGKIYRLTPAGKAEIFYATKQEHILCLAMGDKGTLYAGTDKGGLIYRIAPSGKGFVLYHANQPEVRALHVTPDAVYAGTSAPVARKGSGFFSGSKVDDTRSLGPAPGENSLYRIASDGSVRELYRDKTMILRLGQNHGKLLVATGMQGQLFEVNETNKEKTEIARLDVGQIHCLLQRRDGSIVLGTGDPGKLFVLEDRFAANGTVLSEVLDTKIQSKWGAMTWRSDTPAGTSISVAVRSGNVAEPDDTWSAWSAEQSRVDEAKAKAPLGRYLQYRVTLASENPKATPEFRQFALRYQTLNQAPELTNLEVPDLDTKDLDNPKKLKVRWTASDPNDDELTFNIYCKKQGWNDWVLLEENYEKNNYEWDTTGIPSGLYQIKVVASDRKDNAAEDALTAERISTPVPVTHLPPNVTVKVVGFEGGAAILEASATDQFVRLTEASFAVDGKRWTNVFPVDGLFDSKTETFRFKTDALRPGTHVLVLRVRNAAGNFGSGDVVIRKE
jgi:Two component regulator propeller